ncbi:hypothetical protein OG21DRAFT_379243 [Imleria badia]|nr:hypothetical protein OG21DRAFT_379243 [Imleria badia]
MAQAYASGHQSGIHRSMTSLDEDIPSATIPEGELSCESENLILLPSCDNDTDCVFITGLLPDDKLASSTRGDRILRYWCYGLHAFLVAIHAALVGMLSTHPEHRFSVAVDNTAATIALKVFLQAFYTVRLCVLAPWILT